MDKNETRASQIRELVTAYGELLEQFPELTESNFGLFYQNGRIAYLDLDAFAQQTKVVDEEDGEEKSLAEIKQNIDKNN